MKRKDLLKSREFWITEIQLQLFSLIESYRKEHQLTKTQIAEKLGVTKGYITQILNGDFDHKVSKLVDLALAFGKVPVIHFADADQYIKDDAANRQHVYKPKFKPVEYYTVHIDGSKPGASTARRRSTVKTKKTPAANAGTVKSTVAKRKTGI